MTAAVEAMPRRSGPAEQRRELTAREAVLGRVRSLARRRVLWLQHLSNTESRSNSPAAVRELQTALEDRDEPSAEMDWYGETPSARGVNAEIREYERALEADTESRLGQLCRTFGLSQTERDVLHVCLAVELDPTLAPVYGYLQGNAARPYATGPLAMRLTGHGREPMPGAAVPLFRWRVVRMAEATPGEPAPLSVDPHILDYICDRLAVDPELVGVLTEITVEEPLAAWPVRETAESIQHAIERGAGIRVSVVGPPGSGRRTFSACVAALLGGSALGVDTTSISDEAWPNAFLHAQRQAILLGCALVWYGDRATRRPPAVPVAVPAQFVVGDVDLALPADIGFIEERVAIPQPLIDERRTLWKKFVPESASWPAADLEHVAERYRVTVGDIAIATSRGVSTARHAAELCRQTTRHRLGELAELVDCPFRREDLVLPEHVNASLDDYLFEARERARFWEEARARRLFPRGRGLVALMTGGPGTGKTMAAQVIAAELELDLFRIDVGASVSKYIGETAKNLRRIFARAAEMNAVLLFDEADALFSKRTEVRDSHDRYANTDTNYLLQLIEDFDGVALLASNKRQNMDAAFVRRIRYAMDFPKPAARERLLIWRHILNELAGPGAEEGLGKRLDRLAEVVELTGAQIKLSLLGAIFAARREHKPLALEHLFAGIARELAKEGRSLGPQDRRKVERDG